MNSRQVILGGAAVVVLVVAGVLAVRAWNDTAAESEDFPEGTFWVCTNPDCGAEFVKTIDELGAFYKEHRGAPIPCPKCGKTRTVRAIRCPQCKRFYPRTGRGREGPGCPYCKAPIPRLSESGE